MQGTGTQADPFLPRSWIEFETACRTNGAYIRLDADIYMNNEHPDDVTETNYRFAYLDGNSHKISNLHWNPADTNRMFFDVLNSSIENLQFLDCYLYAPLIRAQNIAKCVFSGITYKQLIVDYCVCERCSFNFQHHGNNFSTFSGWAPVFRHCDIEIHGNVNSMIATLDNSRIRDGANADGHITTLELSTVSGIFNSYVDIPANTLVNGNKVLINTDRLDSGISLANYIGCTTTQLQDAQYLNGIGFPIGVG